MACGLGKNVAKKRANFHEDYHDQYVVTASEKSFSRVFCGFFIVAGALKWHHGSPWAWAFFALAAAFLFLGYVFPAILRPLNLAWMKLGEVMFRIISPVALALLFLTTITSIGLLMRAFGQDPLRLKHDPGLRSYWINRDPAGPAPETMTQQF